MSPDQKKDHLRPVNHSFLREDVYLRIKEAIVQGVLTPGVRLSEASLAERLGTSRTPVREALHRLESEGVIETLPRRGSFVREIPLDQIDELYAVRGLLEGFGARRAVELATEEDIRDLFLLLEEYESIINQGRTDQIDAINERFHKKILSFCGPIVNRTMKDLRGYTIRSQVMAMSHASRPRQVLSEHQELVQAIQKRDADEADRITRKHMASGFKAAMKFFNQKSAEKQKQSGG